MKRFFAIFVSTICLSIFNEANAQNKTHTQDAVYLVSNPQTARWSYVETDSKGQHISTVYYSIDSIEGDGVNGNMKLRVEEVPVASPKDTASSFMFYYFKEGEFIVDVCAKFEDTIFEGKLDSLVRNSINDKYPDLSEEKMREVIKKTKSEFIKTSGEIRGVPRYPKIGKLPDYEFHGKVSIMGINVHGAERKIVGTERILTEAGEFDCFILEETIATKVMIMKDVEKTKSWYAYGIGLVKEITYDKKGKLISTMILNDISGNQLLRAKQSQ
jgi:hypothetical protein